MVLTRSDFGGATNHVETLCSGLADHGITTAAVVGGTGPGVEALRRLGIPTVTIGRLQRAIHPAWDAIALRDVVAALRRQQPDLVACHTAKAGVLGRLAALRLGLPATYTPHGWSFDSGVPRREAALYLALERIAARLPGVIINVCEHDRELAVARRVGKPDRHVTVRLGIPDVADDLLASPASSPVQIVMVARFESQKDPYTLLRALAGLGDRAWTAAVIGDGPDLEGCRRLVAELGIANRVLLPGTRGDVPRLLAESQIFVLSSRWEGLPVSILEAMRAGLPVVASAVGGVSEAVADGTTGILVPPGDVATLRSGLTRLIDDAELRRRFGRAARQRFQAGFRLDGMLAATAALYRRVAAGEGVAR